MSDPPLSHHGLGAEPEPADQDAVAPAPGGAVQPTLVSSSTPGSDTGATGGPASHSHAVVASRSGGTVPRPGLFGLLSDACRIALVSAPAGYGKTVLMRSWSREPDLAGRVGWVSVGREERGSQHFWLCVLDGLRETTVGASVVREVSAAPDLDGWAIVERLLEDLDGLQEPLWLAIDDLHELRSEEALRQLELLLLRAPAELRFVILTRHDPPLGLHRLRLEGEVTEIRAEDLRFTLAEAKELLDAAGVKLSESALGVLLSRTEGWAAGLRLAALSLARHPDPNGFAAEFSGMDRGVADYLLAEVLHGQPPEVRRLLLYTSVLERVSGPLADRLTGDAGSERVLHELEDAGAFVVSLDAAREWFRYHHLFADLLELELRRTAPQELPRLHNAAAEWYAEHGHPVEAVRHAQAAQAWDLAARVLADHWFSLYLNAKAATAHELLTRFPAGVGADDPELTLLKAADELNAGSLEEGERYLALAERRSASVAADRRERWGVMLGFVRLSIARRRINLPPVLEEAQRLLAGAETEDGARLGIDDDLRALALIELGAAEISLFRPEADRHLEQGIALARRIGRPYLETYALGPWANVAVFQSYALAAERGRQASEMARLHGWSDQHFASHGCWVAALVAIWQGRPEEAEAWLLQAERTLRPELEPWSGTAIYIVRGEFELLRGRYQQALDALEVSERWLEALVTTPPHAKQVQSAAVQAMVKMGELERAEQELQRYLRDEGETGQLRLALALLRLAQDDPESALDALAPVNDGTRPPFNVVWVTAGWLLEAIAHDGLGDAGAARRALERALDLAEPDGALLPFHLYPAPELLERHRRLGTAHGGLLSEIQNRLSGAAPAPGGDPEPLLEQLSESEMKILRYLPTHLSAPQIGGELYLSTNTVKTHMRNIYDKLGVHRRVDAVQRARSLGLLAHSSRER